jgi:hypothetical protein
MNPPTGRPVREHKAKAHTQPVCPGTYHLLCSTLPYAVRSHQFIPTSLNHGFVRASLANTSPPLQLYALFKIANGEDISKAPAPGMFDLKVRPVQPYSLSPTRHHRPLTNSPLQRRARPNTRRGKRRSMQARPPPPPRKSTSTWWRSSRDNTATTRTRPPRPLAPTSGRPGLQAVADSANSASITPTRSRRSSVIPSSTGQAQSPHHGHI